MNKENCALKLVDEIILRISLFSVRYISDNFLLYYKHLAGIRGATPKNYTVAYGRVYLSKINYC